MNSDHRNLENIIQIYQDFDVDKVNIYLTLGWIMLNIHTTDYGHPVERHQNTQFTLGWSSENGEAIHPPKKRDQWDDFIEALERKKSSET